jgi:glycolate oxidase FAD binding subunit
VDLALDLSRLTGIMEYVPADMVATVQAGVRLDVLGRELGKHGQMLALDPYGGLSRTVGGVLACGASGPRRFRYGTGRDLLLGARFVQADGTVTWGGSKVVKSVTGYDVPKLLAGSLGTWASSWRRPCAFTPSSPPRARGSSPSPRGRPRRRSWPPSSPPASSPIASPGSMPRRWPALG